MRLPPLLRAAVDAALDGADRTALGHAARELSERYRGEIKDGKIHLDSKANALAYVATRLPATYAAIRTAFAATAAMRGDFAPVTMLDVGAGPGTVLWAACETWPTLADAILVDTSAAIAEVGKEFSTALALNSVVWLREDLSSGFDEIGACDLVTLGYVLNEIAERQRDQLIDRLWELAREVLVIVEPGTPAGWTRILAARDRLIARGADILAPCPHAFNCPLNLPDWCHFSCRVERSRIHRNAKQAEVPWEDEKFIYVAASRKPGAGAQARVIAPPRSASGRVNLKLCRNRGVAEWRLITRREGDTYRRARRLDWGDVI
jgi:ribosomal protein RSM22 (predicted rRNA methylase)